LVALLIAEDHLFFINGIMHSLEDTDIQVVGHVTEADAIMSAFAELKPDVLLCDIKFGENLNGFDKAEELLVSFPDAKVIFLSQFDQDQMIEEAYKRGAKAFLPKSVDSDELIDAIKAVASGELYFTKENAVKLAKLAYNKEGDIKGLNEILTQKEIEILKLLAEGHTEREAAALLSCSLKTITNGKASIKHKLNIEKVASMTKLALKYGLIDWKVN